MMSNEDHLIAAVEGGGTSFVACVSRVLPGRVVPDILHRIEIPSDDPQTTLAQCAEFFRKHRPSKGYQALGVATFGPVGLRKDKENYGHILPSSPKQIWRNVDLLTPLVDACQGTQSLSVQIETDVNAPALAEYLVSPYRDSTTSLAYITVGTGVGVGLVVNRQPVHGFLHPEGGHIPVQPLPNDKFPGYSWGRERSPFGGVHTVEGLASSVALTERLEQLQGQSALSRSILSQLDDDHEIWPHAVNAIANLCVTLFLTLSVETIVLGGGLFQRKSLLPRIRVRVQELLNGYLVLPRPLEEMIVTSQFGADAGLVGALIVAQRAEDKDSVEKKMKSIAFGQGIWHGILVGALGTALVCKYMLFRPKK